MTKRPSKIEQDMRVAAENIDQLILAGAQANLFPETHDPDGAVADENPKNAVGRPKGAKNKGSSKMRQWLDDSGFMSPEARMVEFSGLNSQQDVFAWAMKRSETLLIWFARGATVRVKITGATKSKPATYEDRPWKPSAQDRMDTFKLVYGHARAATEAMMPYIGAKVTPDVVTNTNITQIVMPASQSHSGDGATVINGTSHAPPPMPQKQQQKQQLNNPDSDQSDDESRTE